MRIYRKVNVESTLFDPQERVENQRTVIVPVDRERIERVFAVIGAPLLPRGRLRLLRVEIMGLSTLACPLGMDDCKSDAIQVFPLHQMPVITHGRFDAGQAARRQFPKRIHGNAYSTIILPESVKQIRLPDRSKWLRLAAEDWRNQEVRDRQLLSMV
jgi:hypothetical protein